MLVFGAYCGGLGAASSGSLVPAELWFYLVVYLGCLVCGLGVGWCNIPSCLVSGLCGVAYARFGFPVVGVGFWICSFHGLLVGVCWFGFGFTGFVDIGFDVVVV